MSLRDLPGYNTAILPYHFLRATAAGVQYGWPGKKLRVIGVTGTNGKTTTCFMIWKMLAEAGHKVGLMTTVAYGDSVRGLTKQSLQVFSDVGASRPWHRPNQPDEVLSVRNPHIFLLNPSDQHSL